jgi:hypothetical protein
MDTTAVVHAVQGGTMSPESVAGISLLASTILGYVWQWALFAPKKIPNWAAWAGLGVLAVLCYWWVNPTAATQLHSDWRFTVFSVIQFMLSAKGAGSTAKAFGLAPATNSK